MKKRKLQMKINITIDTGNNAFDGVNRGFEVARILRKIADEYESGSWISKSIQDINGNNVGEVFDDFDNCNRIDYEDMSEDRYL